MKGLLHILIFFCPLLIVGQSKAALFVSNNKQGNAIILKWIYEDVYHPQGFDIYRSESGGNWIKISNSPVTLNKNADDSNYDEETKQLYKAISKTSYEEFSTSIARAFVLIKAIYNNQFANDVGIFYVDNTAQIGKSYKYKIVKHNETKATAESNEITCGEFVDRFEPQEVILERNKKYVSVTWKPDVYSYYGVNIYRKEIGTSDFIKLNKIGPITIDIKTQNNYKTSDIFYADTTVNNEKGYLYKLESIDYFGQQSRFTEEFSVPVKDFIPPAAPFGFKVRPYSVEGFARLTWDAIEEDDLNGFNIYSSMDPEGTFQKINQGLLSKSARKYDTKDLPIGGHYFVVTSVDLAGNETNTGMMFGEIRDVEPPEAPTGLQSKSESGKITLSWNANKEDDLMGYYIQKSISDSNNLDNNYVILNNEICTETTYEIIMPRNVKNEFVYRIVAVDTLYNISKPSINSMAQMPDVIAPQKPVLKNIQISSDKNSLEVSWIENVDTDLAGYNLFRRSKGDSVDVQVNYSIIPSDVTTYKDRSSKFGNQYTYTVKALDNSGNESEFSNDLSFNMKKTVLDGNVVITKKNYSPRKKEMLIEWEWNGEEELKGYVVYEMTDAGILKPITGLNETNEFKLKKQLVSKMIYEIRAYTVKGGIIKSKLVELSPNNI